MSTLSLIGHLIAGAITFALYWAVVFTVKGSERHRRRGRLCLLSLIPVGLSVGPMLVLRSFDPAWLIQFVYLLLCLLAVGVVAWTAIRWKHQLERFRGRHFRILGATLVVTGGIVLAAGIASRQPLPIILSSIGLVFGGAMVRFARIRGPLHPKWWLGWHLNAVLLLSSAVHGTLLAVAYRSLIDPDGFNAAQLVTQPGTLLLALVLRVSIGRQRGVPLGFRACEPAIDVAGDAECKAA